MKICDVCKEELSLGGVAHVIIPHWLFDESDSWDMCKSCANKVQDYIRSLREEAKQKKKKEGGNE